MSIIQNCNVFRRKKHTHTLTFVRQNKSKSQGYHHDDAWHEDANVHTYRAFVCVCARKKKLTYLYMWDSREKGGEWACEKNESF